MTANIDQALANIVAIMARRKVVSLDVAKGEITATPALDEAGKKVPLQGKLQTGIKPKCDCAKSGVDVDKCNCATKSDDEVDKQLTVDIAKASDDEQIVTGIVLQPEVVDAQGDIYDAKVIKEAAHGFLAGFNINTELGYQHKEFKPKRFSLVESWIAPMDLSIGTRQVKAGSWVMSVKVNDLAVWKLIKDGKVKGFSIGGKARVKKLVTEKGAQQL